MEKQRDTLILPHWKMNPLEENLDQRVESSRGKILCLCGVFLEFGIQIVESNSLDGFDGTLIFWEGSHIAHGSKANTNNQICLS